ncbi:NAD(P)-dependent alcohol dehydrogenase [Kamptonema cortianum]|nr:NAD(P)-dependent alcohol dehydrogenase [Geitlerinema splendidum]MDK3158659.1 NAD(P)-dependent alcohol dehydrogenase [Kamptonema cortianum]
MKAITATRYGSPDVLSFEEVERPEPSPGEVLVKIHATGVNAGDWHLLRGEPFLIRLMGFGLLKPKNRILGTDIAGVVEAIGDSATEFKVGDKVFGSLATSGFGGFAEYASARADAMALMPQNVSFEEAASLPTSALTALQALRKGSVQAGMEVLVNGASGGVGSFSVQIAKSLGAHVTGVSSSRNLDLVRELGADEVIDYTSVDFTTMGKCYDVIHAANGYHPISHYGRVLKDGGTYVMTGGTSRQLTEVMLWGKWHSRRGNKTFCNVMMEPESSDLVFIRNLVEAGKVKPNIEDVYSLKQVAEAIRKTEIGHNSGKLVVSM